MTSFPTPGVRLMQLLVVSDYARSLAFYRDVLGATLAREVAGTLAFLELAGGQLILSVPGDPTPDKPDLTFAAPLPSNTVNSESRSGCRTVKPRIRFSRHGGRCFSPRPSSTRGRRAPSFGTPTAT